MTATATADSTIATIENLLSGGNWISATELKKVTHRYSSVFTQLRREGWFIESRPTGRTTKSGGTIFEYRGAYNPNLAKPIQFVRMPLDGDALFTAFRSVVKQNHGKLTTKEAKAEVSAFATLTDQQKRELVRGALAAQAATVYDTIAQFAYTGLVSNT